MPQVSIHFRIEKHQKEIFAGKCRNEEKSMYAILQRLVDKYIKNEVTQNPTNTEIETLQKQLDEKENQYGRQIGELKQQIEALRKDRDSFNIQNAENLGVLNYICNFVLKVTSEPGSKFQIDKKYSDFCFKFIYRNEKQI